MRATLQKYWNALRGSYWFVPTLMSAGAIGLAALTNSLSAKVMPGWVFYTLGLGDQNPDGARLLLSAIAGSMITVAGVIFSITTAAVAGAAQQFGPRLLTNYMQDRGNQVTLGTFIATFLFSLAALPAVQGEDPGEASAVPAHVPHVSVAVALLLAVASVGVLIFFVHHVPESIHVSNVIAGIGSELNAAVRILMPEAGGGHGAEAPQLPADFRRHALGVVANGSGYLETLDDGGLLRLAAGHDLLIVLRRRPGNFVAEGDVLADVAPRGRVDAALEAGIRGCFAWGRQRTQAQDPLFLLHELVEIAVRALSPGINDPFTALICLDWLGSVLRAAGVRAEPRGALHDARGRLRVVLAPVTFEQLARTALDELRPYAFRDPVVSLHLLEMIGRVGVAIGDGGRRALLLDAATELERACAAAGYDRAHAARLRVSYERVRQVLSGEATAEADEFR